MMNIIPAVGIETVMKETTKCSCYVKKNPMSTTSLFKSISADFNAEFRKSGPTSPSSGLPPAEPRNVAFLNILKRANQTLDLTLKLRWTLRLRQARLFRSMWSSCCWMSTGSATIKHWNSGVGGVQHWHFYFCSNKNTRKLKSASTGVKKPHGIITERESWALTPGILGCATHV